MTLDRLLQESRPGDVARTVAVRFGGWQPLELGSSRWTASQALSQLPPL